MGIIGASYGSVFAGLTPLTVNTPTSNLLSRCDQYFEIFNSPDARQKGYGLIDATLRFDTPSGWSASLWAKNLTDKFYTTARLQAVESVGSQYTQRGTPRTYGLTVRHDF